MEAAGKASRPTPTSWRSAPALTLLLLWTINLFNYVDRQVLAAVESPIEKDLHVSKALMGWTATAFLLSYMVLAPIFGYLADRASRWLLIAVGITLWSLASAGTGFAQTATMLILTRCFVGVGEAAYGPVAPSILSDLYPVAKRGRILSLFYLAIPVGSALGYVLGGAVASHLSWRWAFYLVLPPGLALGLFSLFMRDPPRGAMDGTKQPRAGARDYVNLLKNRSYVLDTLGMTAMTFALGGIGFWMPAFIQSQPHAGSLGSVDVIFGAIVVVSGLLATITGGYLADRLRTRFPSSYFLVSGLAMLAGFPMVLIMLWTPFPLAWLPIFLACFFLFFNTGPTNAILANVTNSSIRATAFAFNILIIHALGDAISPPVIGAIADHWSLRLGFAGVSLMMVVGGLFWLWGAKYLAADTAAAPS
jgi:MFS transporter, Spinster family, sphingosine-1-phosphate transporter